MGFEPVHTGKSMGLLLAATLLTNLSILTTNGFQNHTWLLNMPYFNVYKQANVNIVIRSWQIYSKHFDFNLYRISHECFDRENLDFTPFLSKTFSRYNIY